MSADNVSTKIQSTLSTQSLYDYSSSFFTIKNVVSTFATDDKAKLSLPNKDNLVNATTLRDNLSTLTQSAESTDMFAFEFFNSLSLITVNDLVVANLATLTEQLTASMFEITSTKLDDELSDILMEFSEGISIFDMLTGEDDSSIYQVLSTPDYKLYYPEPFIASPSFVHEELWFIHILHYQHWLWFMFISLIMFYFITFINVVRWCNMRTRPRRETRGVSRSKCADLITATVPVSWAASIIISESVDATDYYDGFGSGEIIVGIRAYQWGWEYFYPKGIDLNYGVSPSYSAVVGNSLKYTNASSSTLKSNTLWKHYKSRKISQTTSTPAHLLLSPSDNSKVLNFMNFSDLGVNSSKDADSFKKIQYFSKTNPQALFGSVSDFSSRYSKLSDLYLNDSSLSSSAAYGTFRQHNYVTKLATTNNYNSIMDESSFNKHADYNLNMSYGKSEQDFSSGLTTVANSNKISAAGSSLRIANLLSGQGLSEHDSSFASFLQHPTKSSLSDSETDQKAHKNPLKYALGDKWIKSEMGDKSTISDVFASSDFETPSPLTSVTSSVTDSDVNYRFKNLKSSNLSVLSPDRNARLIGDLVVGKTNRQFDGVSNSFNSLVDSQVNSESALPAMKLFNSSLSQWANTSSASRLVGNNLTVASSHIPVTSNNPAVHPLSFDKFTKGNDDTAPTMLRSKEEVSPLYLFNTYWLTHWAHTNPEHRYEKAKSVSDLFESMYFPTFVDYAEYDFRNWQALELLEDAFWESTYSTYAHDEYLNSFQDAQEARYLTKQETLFNLENRSKESKTGLVCKSFLSNPTAFNSSYPLPLFSEDSSSDLSLTALKNFESFSAETSVDAMDDTYENLKHFNYIHHASYKNLFMGSSLSIAPVSYSQILDTFTSSYDERATHSDNVSFDSVEVSSLEDIDFQSNVGHRATNPLKLRSSAKNSLITYNALQKVFKSRFDEGRSNARLQDFSNSAVAHPFVTAKRTPYESLLAKNTESFYATNNYVNALNTNFSELFSVWGSLNVYFADLPFLVSMKSDPSRYLWFDWQSRWSSMELQPSSVARYSLLGVPYSTKSFEYDTASGDEINDSENYLVRLARARKNYMPSWAYTPYFYAKMSNWYKAHDSANTFFTNKHSLDNTRKAFQLSKAFWTKAILFNNTTNLSTPSFSGVNTFARSSSRPTSGIQSYYYTSSILVDILSKREYLYRQYLLKQGASVNLPKYFVAAPNNPLLEEVKSSYPLIDPASFSSELSRELFYQNVNFLRFNIIKDFLHVANSSIANSSVNLSGITNYLFFYLFGFDQGNNVGRNMDLFKSQYRPMRKGVTNMIRLHATGAIAMPIEIRMHILASSKDVIHSWAVPSAGIKIDCVPGYSSHRITIFLVSGIFWGQCMEICGRFHHWMPIIVYFMKRDLFFLWCTHFMHYSSIDKTFDMTDRQLADHVRLVSFDKTTWVHELNNIL